MKFKFLSDLYSDKSNTGYFRSLGSFYGILQLRSFLAVTVAEYCTCKTRNRVDIRSELSIFPCAFKTFNIYFYFVMFSISFSNFLINNRNYLLLKQFTDWARKYKLFLLLYAKTQLPFRNDFQVRIYVYSVCGFAVHFCCMLGGY